MTKDAATARDDDLDLGKRFARLALRAGGPLPQVAIKRAQKELARLKPELSQLIATSCSDLETALLKASQDGEDHAYHVAQAHAISESLRDIGGSLGFSFVGFIASNLCTVFETVSAAGLPYPHDVVGCHLKALQLAQANMQQGNITADLPELTAGLAKIVQVIKNAAALVAVEAGHSNDHVH